MISPPPGEPPDADIPQEPLAPPPPRWQEEALENVCPCCFNFRELPSDFSVGISVDGNMQHKRFRDRSPWEFEVLRSKLFVRIQERSFSLAADAQKKIAEADKAVTERGGGCTSTFKATQGWNATTTKCASKAVLDESGLVGAVCFHGIGLRFLNIHGTGERHTHVVAILEEIYNEHSDIDRIRLCYDVGCKFETAAKTLLPGKNITPRIGRFHLLGHGLSCQVNYNTTRTTGFGLMVGEELEQLWSYIQHLIRSGRVSSSPRKRQKLDSCLLYLAQRMREIMGLNLQRRWKRMNEIRKDALDDLEKIIGRRVPSRTDDDGSFRPESTITKEYLEEQYAQQVLYYRTYKYV
jgi:hypothetical protein